MHESVAKWVRQEIERGSIPVSGRRVLEVGALDVNGSIRATVLSAGSPLVYHGIDMRGGPGVDEVLLAENASARFGENVFDLVLCLETLEHVCHWREAMTAMRAVLVPGGHLLLTTRGPGFPPHDYPGDYWRFTVPMMRDILSDMDIVACVEDGQAGHPGVFAHATKPAYIESSRIVMPLAGIAPIAVRR